MNRKARFSMCFVISGLFFLASLGMTGLNAQAAGEKDPQPAVAGEQKTPAKPVKAYAFKNDEEKVNYAIGVQLIGNFQRQGHKVNLDMVTMGMRDALAGGALALPDGELRRLILLYQNAVKRGYIQQKKNAAEKQQ